MKKTTEALLCVLLIAVCAVGTFFLGRMYMGRIEIIDSGISASCVAKVLEITGETSEDFTYGETTVTNREVHFRAKLITGAKRGLTVDAVQFVDGTSEGAAPLLEVGDRVLVNDVGGMWSVSQLVRADALLVLAGVFLLLIIIFGKMQGVKTMFSLVLTCAAIFAVFVPAILGGSNIYTAAVVVTVYITVMTIPLISGFNKKSVSAILGCVSGVAASGLITYVFNSVMKMTGFTSEEAAFLLYMDGTSGIDLRGIIFAGIVIGSLGATMDVAVSLSSALYEIKENADHVGFDELVKSGMNIGRDMMGTMTNTLILAYIGSSLATVLLLVAYGTELLTLLNREMIVVEILRALAGSLGILLTIPLGTFISSFLFSKGGRKGRHG